MTRVFKSSLSDADDIWFGVVYEPYVPDAHGQWMRPEWIRRACNTYGMRWRAFNAEHERPLPSGEISLAQNWVAPTTYQDGDEPITMGTWLAGVKLRGETLRMAESGEFTGFSLEGPGFIVDHAALDYEAFDSAE